MLVSELISIIKEAEQNSKYSFSDCCSEAFDSKDIDENSLDIEIALNKKEVYLKQHDTYGGELDGQKYGEVFKLTNKDGSVQYFRAEGWYKSYYGYEIDYYDLEEVHLVPETVYRWRTK